MKSSHFSFACLLLAWWTPAAAAPQGPSFDTGQPISSRVVEPNDITLFDVDADGDLDLVLPEQSGGRLLWQENLAGGELDTLRRLDTPLVSPSAVRGIDILNDGVEELLVIEQDAPSNRLTVLSPTSGGLFQVTSTFNIPGGGSFFADSSLEVVDMDGDGDLDAMVVSNIGGNFVKAYVAFQDSQGGFSFVRPNPSAPIRVEETVAIGDLDGNGLADVIMRLGPGDLGYVPQQSPGVFGPPVALGPIVSSGPPEDLDAVDYDGDGDIDVVVSFQSSPSIFVHENLSGQGFGPRMQVPTGLTGSRWIDPLDMDGDGDLDFLVSTLPNVPGVDDRGILRWVENRGALGFEVRNPWAAADVRDGLARALLGDWDGDGAEDYFVVRLDEVAGCQVIVYGGRPASGGALALEPSPAALTDVLFALKDLAAMDVDGDGDLDLLTAARFLPTTVAINVGPGRFERPAPLPGAPPNGRYIVTGDVDGDGRVDAVIVTQTGRIFWLRNRHNGTVAATALGGSSPTFNDSPVLADVDTDGDLDVVAVSPTLNQLLWYEQTAPGIFAAAQLYLALQGSIVEFELADVDADGALDVVVIEGATGATARVRRYLGQGGTSFGPATTLHDAASDAGFLRIADLDATSALDVLWFEAFARQVVGVLGTTGTSFAAASALAATTGRGRCMEVVMSPNGDVNLAVGTLRPASTQPDRVEYFRSTGAGTFAAAEAVDEGLSLPRALLVADLDGDGDLDLASASENNGRLYWYPGRGVPALGESFCAAAQANSTGRVGRLIAVGAEFVSANDLRLIARDLRPGTLTLFLGSMTQGSTPMAGGGEGTLCLGGDVGRFLGPGQAGLANADGSRDLEVDLTLIPQPAGFVHVTSGQTWSFQAWHRDAVGGAATSNFTEAVALSFL